MTKCSASARARSPSIAAAREDKLAHKPTNLTFEQAAAVPVSGLTALQGCAMSAASRPARRC